MKTRLAHKIINTTFKYQNWDSNYQPYSISQQQKAFKVMKPPISARKTLVKYGVFGKVPTEYRRYNPIQIYRIMNSKKMDPKSVKEYRACMIKILRK